MSIYDNCTENHKLKIDYYYEVILSILSRFRLNENFRPYCEREISNLLFEVSNASQFHLNVASEKAFELIQKNSKSEQKLFSREHPRSRTQSAKYFIDKYKLENPTIQQYHDFVDSEGIQIYITKEEHRSINKSNCLNRKQIIEFYNKNIQLIEFEEITKNNLDKRKRIYKKIKNVSIEKFVF